MTNPDKELTRFRVRRGNEKNIPVLYQGELGFSTDKENLFIGSGSRNVELADKEELNNHKEDNNPHIYGNTFFWRYNTQTENFDLVAQKEEVVEGKKKSVEYVLLNVTTEGKIKVNGESRVWDDNLLNIDGSPPENPETGTLWVDRDNGKIDRWNGDKWKTIISKGLYANTTISGGTF